MNVYDDPEYRAWADHARNELVPKLQDSAAVMSLVPDEGGTDIKFAVELGLSIMMNKPLVLIVAPGRVVPYKLVRIADAIIEADLNTPEGNEIFQKSVNEFITNRLSDLI